MADEVVKWRDAAVHRTSPLVLPSATGPPVGNVWPNAIAKLVMIEGIDFQQLLSLSLFRTPAEEPLYLHIRWRDGFLAVCQEICEDIAGSA